MAGIAVGVIVVIGDGIVDGVIGIGDGVIAGTAAIGNGDRLLLKR